MKPRYLILITLGLILSPALAFGFEGTLNPNTATNAELQKLPFVGKAKAKAILDCRTHKGHFSSLADIQSCPDIGQSTIEAIQPYLAISGATTNNETYPSADAGTEANYRFTPRIVTQPGEIKLLPDSVYYDTLLNFIRYAQDRIDIALFLFKTTSSPKNKPSLIVKALGEAKKRGVAVSVLLERSNYDESLNQENERTAKLLRKRGIKVRFDGLQHTTHSKIVLIDNRFCFVGSHNFSHSALSFNNELSLLVDNTALAQELQRYLTAIDK